MPGRTVEQHDVVVVGAGWTGLISAKTYLQLSPETDLRIVDNGQTIGGVWSQERLYPDLYAQIAWPLFQYSFYPMPRDDISRDGYISGYTIHKYLNDFARDHDLIPRTRLSTQVNSVKRTESGGWFLSVNNGPDLNCRKLIWAIGPASSPVTPAWPKNIFTSPVIHSSHIGQHLGDIGAVKRATVVGAAKSSLDTVYLLLKAGKEVDWVIREDGSGPLAMAAPTLFGIWNITDVISTRALASFSPSIMSTSGSWYYCIHRTRLGRAVAKGFWWLANRVSENAAGYSTDENFQQLRPTPLGLGLFWARAGLGTASAPDFWKTLHAGDLTVHRTEIGSLSHTDVVNFKNGISVQTDMVIACTGFEKPYRPFSSELREQLNLTYSEADRPKWEKLDAQGEQKVDDLFPILKEWEPPLQPLALPVNKQDKEHLHGPSRHYRRMVSPRMAAIGDRSVFFPGVVHVIFTPLVSEFQALWGAAYLLDRIDLPSQEQMEEEAASFNVWVRKRYLEQGRKHAFCIFDYLSYIDTLAKDLGIRTARKSNPFSEMFVRYKPSDYAGMMDEFLAAQQAKREFPLDSRKKS